MSVKNQLARPCVLTPQVQTRIVDLIAGGASLYASCYVAGTTYDAVMYWRRLCEDGVDHAQIYADFFESIKRAQSLTEVKAVDAILSGENNWQSRAWFLERRFPQRWAAKQRDDKPQAKQAEVIEEAKKKADARRNDRKPV